MTKAVVGVFRQREDIERAISVLASEGYTPKEFTVFLKNPLEALWVIVNTGASVKVGSIPEELASYESRINKGAMVLVVPTRENQLELVRMVFDDSDASDSKHISYKTDAPRPFPAEVSNQNYTTTNVF